MINKADAADPLVAAAAAARSRSARIAVSARTGQGIDELLALIDNELPRPSVEIEALVPYTARQAGRRVRTPRARCSPRSTPPEGTLLKARVHEELAAELRAVRSGAGAPERLRRRVSSHGAEARPLVREGRALPCSAACGWSSVTGRAYFLLIVVEDAASAPWPSRGPASQVPG